MRAKCPPLSKPLNDSDFQQLMAEVVDKFGVDAVMPHVEVAARRYGWPIPESRYDDAMRMILRPLMLGKAAR